MDSKLIDLARHLDLPPTWENGHVESFNGKLRDELLTREIAYTFPHALPKIGYTNSVTSGTKGEGLFIQECDE